MCEFCKKENIARCNDIDSSPCICISNDGEYKMCFHGLDYEYYNIKFCPMCGRELSEVNNNDC